MEVSTLDTPQSFNNNTTLNPSKTVTPKDYSYLETFTYICGCLNIALTVVGVLGNTLSIAIFSRKSQPPSMKFQLIGLSIVDLLLLICFIPLVIIPEFVFSFGGPPHIMDIIHYSFVYLYPWAVTFQTISVLILILITTERFLAVCFPIHAKLYWTEFWGKLALFLIFILGMVLNMIRFWEYKIRPCNGTDECSYCSVVAEQFLHKNQTYIFWYKFLIPAICALIACIFLTVLNVAIATTVWFVKKRYAELNRSTVAEHNIAKMMFIIVAVFVLCYGLHIYMYFDEVIVSLGGGRKGFSALDDISHTLVIVNSATTCFIYCMCESYRNEARSLLERGLSKFTTVKSEDHGYEMVNTAAVNPATEPGTKVTSALNSPTDAKEVQLNEREQI